MRLARYLAVEVIVAALLLGAAAAGGAGGALELRARLAARRAALAAAPVGEGSATRGGRPLAPRRDLSAEPPLHLALESSGTFLGMSDELLLERIRTQPVTRLKLNRGGSSLSFRVDFADGSRAAWKPAQTNGQTVPRKEVAAYRINRLLGLNSVAPAAPRAIRESDIYALLHPDSAPAVPRIRAETLVGPGGMVAGAASYWIPIIKESGLDTPAGREETAAWLSQGGVLPYQRRGLAAQVSNLVVFDFLIANPDRYSGGNMKASADGNQLYFMDNTMSFFLDADGPERNRDMLQKTQRFSRSLHDALPRVDLATLRRLLAEPDGTEILTDAEMRAVVARRQLVERHIDALVAAHGQANVLMFP